MLVRVSPYKKKIRGKTVTVKGYRRNQKSDRGTKGKARRLKGVSTFWIKDKQGHFIGRAPLKSKTFPSSVFSKGKDSTGSVQENSKGRILGRYKAS